MIDFHPKTLTAKSFLWAKSLIQALTVGGDIDQHSRPSKLTDGLEEGAGEQVEKIRNVMLRSLRTGCNAEHQRLERRVRLALDAQALWYLRSDLMAVLSESTDERQAREQLQRITAMFRGLVPESMFGYKAYMH